ncbi:MAG: thymidine phosphorylase [Clostridiales bacterium]|nr:thymidine phosphorylase [Clostridiales bacterium]
MDMYDIIRRKRDGHELTDDDIAVFINGCCDGSIPDYQISALLMAIWFRGMTEAETAALTLRMEHSGETVDLTDIDGLTVDKHSTGGVGDKTTLAVAPILAACGLKIPKMSGRGLGHTGGTIDKLESIPGFDTALGREKMISVVKETGLCVVGQSSRLVPADKKLYALRDVTATVDSMPLIASSIMSKKLAAGAKLIVLDVKYGSGAFLTGAEDAVSLASLMVRLGEAAGRRVSALITYMDEPLGRAVGNSLEVAEAVETLRGKGPEDFMELVIALSADALYIAGLGGRGECADMARCAIKDGTALRRLRAMVAAQGGDPAYIDDPGLFGKAEFTVEVPSPAEGYISEMDTAAIGRVSTALGAGRLTADEAVDHSAGIMIYKKKGAFVKVGETLAVLHTNRERAIAGAVRDYADAIAISQRPPEKAPLIYASVDSGGVIRA